MNIYLDVQSPAVKEATKLASAYGLQNHGLVNLRRVYWNLPTPALEAGPKRLLEALVP